MKSGTFFSELDKTSMPKRNSSIVKSLSIFSICFHAVVLIDCDNKSSFSILESSSQLVKLPARNFNNLTCFFATSIMDFSDILSNTSIASTCLQQASIMPSTNAISLL